MFESGSYKSLPKHVALYEALEASIKRANKDEFLAEKDKSRKRSHDDQDPPQPPPHDSDQSKKDDPSGSSKQKTASQSEQHVKDILVPIDVHISDSEDTNIVHLFKFKPMPDWLKPIPEEDRPTTPEPHWTVPLNNLPKTKNNWANALANSYQDPDEFKLLRQTGDIGSFIKWFCKRIGKKKLSKVNLKGTTFKRKEFYINRHSAPSDHRAVISHMRILSVVSLKTISRYGYTHLKEIVLRRADYKEYKILESNFKNLHPNDFEDMYLLHLQGKFNHLNDQKKMMRETEVHKFSDGTLTRILEKLDHMVKDFKLFKYNPGMETRIWFEDDRRRSKEFIEVIEIRLKTRRIFRSLESFVSGRLRDVDYRLIQRTE
nr:hypothetical protein [Tanacetum cinerariifolium]